MELPLITIQTDVDETKTRNPFLALQAVVDRFAVRPAPTDAQREELFQMFKKICDEFLLDQLGKIPTERYVRSVFDRCSRIMIEGVQ